MQPRPFPFLAVAASIAVLAGFVDAYAFIRIGNFFVSFMSGNATRGGVALAGGSENAGSLALSLILAFLAGVILAAIVTRRFERTAALAVMLLSTVLLGCAAISGTVAPAVVMPLLAAAMGAVNGVLQGRDGIAVGLTYMTGNLVKLGQSLAAALMGERPYWRWVPYLVLWIAFVGGAVGAAIVEHALGELSLWYATALAAWITLLLAVRTLPKRRIADRPPSRDGRSDR